LLAVLALAPAFTRAQDTKEDKEKKVRKVLEVSGYNDIAKTQFEQMVKMFETNPQLPPGFAKKFKEISGPQELIELVVPIYKKHFSDEELDGMLEFYNSPLGKKLASKQGAITEESKAAGEKWGMALGMRVMNALQKGDKGDDKDDDEDAPKPKKEEKKKGDKPKDDF
jgi:hypothetical protein